MYGFGSYQGGICVMLSRVVFCGCWLGFGWPCSLGGPAGTRKRRKASNILCTLVAAIARLQCRREPLIGLLIDSDRGPEMQYYWAIELNPIASNTK